MTALRFRISITLFLVCSFGMSSARTETLYCEAVSLRESVLVHARSGNWLDVHGLSQAVSMFCPKSPARFRFVLLDALALDELDEPFRAEAALRRAILEGDGVTRTEASLLLGRHYLRLQDDPAFSFIAGRLDPGDSARLRVYAYRDDASSRAIHLAYLPLSIQREAIDGLVVYDRARYTKRPWLAGVSSALLPGAGQAYAGSWQAAGVAFLLNSVLIGSTAELAVHRLYFSAGAAGVASSIFYLGNILNAVDLARRRNEMASEESRARLERMLIPEAFP